MDAGLNQTIAADIASSSRNARHYALDNCCIGLSATIILFHAPVCAIAGASISELEVLNDNVLYNSTHSPSAFKTYRKVLTSFNITPHLLRVYYPPALGEGIKRQGRLRHINDGANAP